MQFNFFLISLLFALSAAAFASDADIFEDGSVENAPAVEVDAHSTPTRRTNASATRMRRGLKPLPPTRRRRGHLKHRVPAVDTGKSGPCDPVSTQGVIKAHATADGSFQGYISEDFNSLDLYTLTTNLKTALMFSLPSTPAEHFNTAMDISSIDGPSSACPLLGSVGSSEFGTGQSGFSYLAGVTHTDASMPPSSIAATSLQALGHDMPSESQIWTMSCSLDISAQWINPSGSRAPTTVFYDPVANFLGLTGDLTSLSAAYPHDNVIAVSFTFVPA